MGKRAERKAAIARVRQFEIDRNVAGLIQELSNPLGRGRYGLVRTYAVLALEQLAEPRAVPYLVPLARTDPVENVRMHALLALGRIGSEEATPTLLAGLADPAPIARMAAASALGTARASGAIPALRMTLDRDTDPEVRLEAAEALAELGDDSVAVLVPSVLADISWRVRLHPNRRRLRAWAERVAAGDGSASTSANERRGDARPPGPVLPRYAQVRRPSPKSSVKEPFSGAFPEGA